MLTYQHCQELTAKRPRRKLANNTYLESRGESFAVRLHKTDVVTIKPDGSYTLNSGGWRTLTTKDRINNYSPARVSQVRGVWYVGAVTYFDGCTVGPDGNLPESPQTVAEADKRKDDAKLVAAFIKALRALPELPEPGPGDCWICSMFGGTDCVRSHLEELYIHGALIVRAMTWAGYKREFLAIHWDMWKRGSKTSVISAVRRYAKDCLNKEGV